MLTRLLSRLRRIAPANRPAPKARLRALNLEALEAREVPAVIYALADNNVLLRFDSTLPGTVTSTTTVTGLGAGELLQGIDFRPRTGQLYGSTIPAGSAAPQVIKTYTINLATGAATLVGATAATVPGAADVAGGYDFNPTVDRIRYVNENDENVRLNPVNGTLAGDDTNITPGTAEIIGAAYDRNTDRQNATNIKTTLYVIDRNTGMLATLGTVDGVISPNGGVLAPVGLLGVTPAAGFEGGFDILESGDTTLNNGGLGIAYAALTVGATTSLYTINLTTGAATLVGAIGAGGTEVFSLAAVPDDVVVVGSGAGATGDVRLLDPNTGAIRATVSNPFAGFQGGVRVAAGDVNGDGIPDAIITAVAPNGHVKVFDGATGAQLGGSIGSFLAFAGFQGTVSVGSGDVDGDGFADVLVSADGVLNGHVKAFSGRTGLELASFFAYPGFLGNLTVSGADFNNDGVDEIVTAATNNGHVKVFGVAAGAATPFVTGPVPGLSSFFAFQGFTSGGVNVAAGDVTGDGFADIVVAAGAGAPGGHVKVFNGQTAALASSFLSLPTSFTGGASLGLADANSDGLLDIRVTPGAGAPSQLFTFNLNGTTLLAPLTTFVNFQGGSTVAGARY